METGVVTIQEPVSTKTNVGEAPAGVILDHFSMEVDKVNLSTVLDDEIITTGKADVVNGSGNTETEEETKTTSVVEDCKIVKDDQDSIFVHEPQSSTEDVKIVLSDVTLDKEKEDNLTRKPEEVSVEKPVIEEDQTETKHSQKQEEEIGNISKAREEIPIKTDEVKEETDSRTVETFVNGTEAEHNGTVSVEDISRNGVNIVNETVAEKEMGIDGEPIDETETTEKAVQLEAEKQEDKEEMKIDEEPRLNAIEKLEPETVKTVIEDSESVHDDETTVHESESLKENQEPVEATSREVTVDREKDEAITQNTEEVQESPRVIETPTIQGEDIESKAETVDEHVLVKDIPQSETLVTESETVDTSTVQEAEILKTNINETEAMHGGIGGEEEGQETMENTKPSHDLKEDKEEEEIETVKTIISSDEVRSSDVQCEHSSSETKDESHGGEKSVEFISTETVQEESTEDLLDVPSTESEKIQENEPETSLVADTETPEKFEESPSDLALNVDKEKLKDEKINVDQVDGTQIMEEQRGLDSNGAEAEQIDQNRTDETEESQVAKADAESVEQMQKPTLDESPSEVSEESSKTVDEKIGERQEEEVTPHQQGQEEGSYGLETKERNVIDLNPLKEESSQQNEQEKETKLEQHEPIDQEVKSGEVIEVSSASPSNELKGETVVEVEKIENIKENEEEQETDKIHKSLETVEAHSLLPSSSEEHEHETVFEKIEDEKVQEVETKVEAEQTRDIEPSLTEQGSKDQTQHEEQVKETSSRDEQENEILNNSENIVNETYALHSAEAAEEETATNGASLNDFESTKRVLEMEKEEEEAEIKTDTEPSLDAIEKTVIEETKAHESENLKGDDHQDENAESVEEDITNKVEEVKESARVIATATIQEEDIEPKALLELKEEVDQSSKDTMEHVLERDIAQCETLEVEAVDTSTDQEASILKTLETSETEDKEQKEVETVKAVIVSDEVRPSDQVDAQAEELDEHTEACSSEIKDESQGRDEQEHETSKNSENIVNETNGESLNDGENTKGVLLEVEKEKEEAEVKTYTEPKLDTIEKTVIEETTAHESESLKGDDHQDENAESVEAIRYSNNAEQISSEVKESPRVIETPTIQGEDIESKASLELKEEVDQSSKDTVEHVLERDIPQCETLEAESLDTSTDQEASILKTLDTNINETDDKEEKEAETVKTVISSDEQVRPSDQEFDEHTEACSSEIKDESQGREESVEVISKEIVKDESSEEKDVNLLGVRSGESEKYQDNEPETSLVSKTERADEFEYIPSSVDGAGLDETTHNQTLVDVESVEKVHKSSLETPSELSEETSTNVAEKKEEVTLHQEGQKEGSHGSETKEVTVSEQESKNLGEQAEEEDSCLPNEQVNETKLQEEVSNDHQGPVEEKSDEVIQVSSASLSEGPEGETVVETEKIGGDETIDEEEQVEDKIQESFETAVTVEPHSSLPSSLEEQEHEIISEKTDTVALPLEENEKVTSTEKGETKENQTEDDKPEAKKEDEEITVGPLNTSENVCMQQEEIEKLEAPKLEESKEDKSQEIDETIKEIEAASDQTLPIEASQIDDTQSTELVSEQEDKTPNQVEEIHEEESQKVEATGDQNLSVETSQADDTPSSELVSELDDQTLKQVEEIHEEILPTEIIPRDSSDGPLASMLASKEDGQVTLQADNCAEDIREAKDTQVEQHVSAEPEKSEGETKPKEPEDVIQDEKVETPTSLIISEKIDNETLIVEESKEEKSQEITETVEAIEDTSDQTLPVETSQADQTLSSDDQTPRQVEEIHEEETKEERKFEATCDKSLRVETLQECQTPSSDSASGPDDQTPKKVEEVHEEETKEEHKLQGACDKILPVETSQTDKIPKQIEEVLEEEEETKETHKVQAEEVLSTETVIRESFSEAPVSMLASGEDEPVTPQEEQHVSAETEERVAEGTEKATDQVETSLKLSKVEDESAKKTDVEVDELTNDYPTEETEHGDETYSTLPVVGILTELQNTLESERTINDSASLGENMNKEHADQELKKGDVEVESNKEEVKVQDGISRDFEFNVEAKLQEEETIEIPGKQEESKVQQDASLQEEIIPRAFEISKKVGDNSDHVMESEQKTEVHETVKEEDQIVDFKEVKKSEEVHDEKLEGLSATTDTEETFSSQVKKVQEDVSELGVGHDIASPQVEKEEEPHSVLGNDEEINEVVTSEKQITDPVVIIKKAEHDSNQEHVQPQAISDDKESNIEKVFPIEEAPKDQREEVSVEKSLTKEALDDHDLSIEKPSELVQPHQSPNEVEETSFEVKKAQEHINEETVDALLTNENVQVQDQLKDFEAPVEEKETSEKAQKSNDLTHVKEDIGTNVKVEARDEEIRSDGHDSAAELKEETCLTEEKRDLDNVKTELEDAIKHEVSVEEKKDTSENIEATKEINQEESKQTYVVKEEIREEEEETNQESFKNVKKTDDAIEKTQPEIGEIESLSSASKTDEKSELKDEVSKLESPKIAEELQQKDRESEDNKGLFSEVKETEPTLKEPARKSLSDLIEKVKGTTTTTEPHIEEKPKTEEEEDDGDQEHNKDDKTSPDSIVMVEAKDTVSIIKTQKKPHGILSGVGSKVKHSISKVKKVLTGKSTHTTKPSSPK